MSFNVKHLQVIFSKSMICTVIYVRGKRNESNKYLRIDGAKQSPEKRIKGFLSEYCLIAVLIRAAPPTGSCFSLESTLYTSLKWIIVSFSVATILCFVSNAA